VAAELGVALAGFYQLLEETRGITVISKEDLETRWAWACRPRTLL